MEIIQHFSHEHPLTFCEDSRQKSKDLMTRRKSSYRVYYMSREEEEIESPMCNGCNQAVDDDEGGYFCETCEDFFWLHKSCSLLPHKLQHHPLHSSHPLTLIAKPPPGPKLYRLSILAPTYFICEECRELCPGFAYHCAECQFYLDVKCALALIDGSNQRQRSSRQLLDTKAEMNHPSHIHQLIFLNSRGPPSCYACAGCEMPLQGPVYGCCKCTYFLHKSCAEIPQEIQHPYHPQHPLLLHYYETRRSNFICDGCRDISRGFAFQCERCRIKLDVKCALLTQGSLGQRSEEYETNTRISHFSHRHRLLLFNNVKVGPHLKCTGCKLMLSGLGYGCLECGFYLHKSCAEIPREIHHSYHPFHPLRAQMQKYFRCAACKVYSQREETVYNCSVCDFNLHILCAKVSLGVAPALKHNCHNHSLYYFVGKSTLLKNEKRWYLNLTDIYNVFCNVCGKHCEGPIYTCLECECSFHLECIPIPQVVFKRDSHMHSLTLREPLVAAKDEDISKEYYCFACERERNPKYHAYYCDQCPYEAHIECMVSEFVDEEYYNSAWSSNNVDEINGVAEFPTIAEYTVPRCRKQLEIEDFSNNHVMIYHRIFVGKQCYGCRREIFSPAFTCEFCNISFHRACVELPPKIRHYLHLLHPLQLFNNALECYKCDGCATISYDDAYYQCKECQFILDIKWASDKDKRPILEERDDDAIISHFSHRHKLLLANCPEFIWARCWVCLLYISGPAYCCPECKFCIHESCCKIERVIHKHPFHPEHPLVWKAIYNTSPCKACKLPHSDFLVYHCSECRFSIDYTCSKYLSSTLKYKNHEHSLYYFVTRDLRNEDRKAVSKYGKIPEFLCEICKTDCNESFYRCLECDLNLHLQCMALPQKVKGAFHMHPVTFKDSVVQENYEEQYCYACEDIRNPDHAVYSCDCEGCIYIAHIGCVLDEADDSPQIFPFSIASPSIWNLRMEFGETSGKVDCEVVLLTDSVKESKKEPLVIVEAEKEVELLAQEMKSLKSN